MAGLVGITQIENIDLRQEYRLIESIGDSTNGGHRRSVTEQFLHKRAIVHIWARLRRNARRLFALCVQIAQNG